MSPAAVKFMEGLSSVPMFAHHPTCDCYSAHLLRFGSFALCLGCTCMMFGGLIATTAIGTWCICSVTLIPIGWKASFGTAAIGVMLYLPTLIQPFWQYKPFKIGSRMLLGAAIPVLAMGGWLMPPLGVIGILYRGFFLVAFLAVLRATLNYRSRFTPNPCTRCLPAVFPFCNGNRPRLAALLADLQASSGSDDADFLSFATALVNRPKAVSFETIQLDGHLEGFVTDFKSGAG